MVVSLQFVERTNDLWTILSQKLYEVTSKNFGNLVQALELDYTSVVVILWLIDLEAML